MGYASKEALMEYLHNKGSGTFLSIFGLFAFFMGFVSLTLPDGNIAFLIFAVIGAGFLFMGRSNKSTLNKYLSIAASTGELQRILNDFAASQSLADDRIRLGSEYIFGRKMGRPISYSELRKVYPFIVTGTTCARYLKGVTADGQEHIICEFIVRGSQKTPHPDENAIYQHILSKNPHIYLGYK